MASTIVPQIEINRITRLILDRFKNQYGREIALEAVTRTFITPRPDCQIGLELYSTATTDNFRSRTYIRFKDEGSSEIYEFKTEDIQGTPVSNSFEDACFVCYADLPKGLFPTLSKVKSLLPDVPQDSLYDLGFVPQNYTVVSGEPVSLNLRLSATPDVQITADFQTEDVTSLEGVDYSAPTINGFVFTPGTVQLDIPIEIKTGDSYYYYWKPRSYYLNEVETLQDNLGLTFTLENKQLNVWYPELTSVVEKASLNSMVYHELELNNTALFPLGNQGNTIDIDFDLLLQLKDTAGNEFEYSRTFSFFYNPTTTPASYHVNGAKDGAGIPLSITDSRVTPVVQAQILHGDVIRIGFVIKDNWQVKANINGQWFNFDDNSQVSDNFASIVFGNNDFLNDFPDPDQVTGELAIRIRPILNAAGDENAKLAIKFNVGTDTHYKPTGAVSPTKRHSPTSGGTFNARLSNAVNASLVNNPAVITIQNGNHCYIKLIEENDKDGFTTQFLMSGLTNPGGS